MNVDSTELQDQVALVTGGGRGIGLGIADALALRGAKIVLNDLDSAVLDEAAGSVAGDTEVHTVAADVTERQSVRSMVDNVMERFGKIDILVNNAGVLVVKDFLDHTDEDWDLAMNVNLKGIFLCCQEVLPKMIDAGYGAIVNMASMGALGYTMPHVVYATSKAGVIALTRDLSHEVAPLGIRVNAIAPGPIASRMTEGFDAPMDEAIRQRIRVASFGTPDDIGEATAFLVSERSRFIIGTTMTVAGGADMRGFKV